MKEKVMLLTCDRCQKQVSLKSLGKESFDGGFTNEERFEDKPEGWKAVNDFSFSVGIGNVKHLCPDCSEKFLNLLNQFWTKVDSEAKDD